MKKLNGPQRIRQLLAQPGIIRSLGAHDVFTALIVERAGFETVFIGGFGTSASMLGLPDLNFLTMTEMADAVRRMAARVRIPVIADGDTGHGDLHNVQRTVATFERAGGKTPILPMDQLADLGYKIAVCPIESLLVTARAMQRLVNTLKETGRVDQAEGMVSFAEVKEILGVAGYLGLREMADG